LLPYHSYLAPCGALLSDEVIRPMPHSTVLVFPEWMTYTNMRPTLFRLENVPLIVLSSNHDQEPSDKYFISFALYLKAIWYQNLVTTQITNRVI